MKPNIKRLRKLAQHIRFGRCAHEVFNILEFTNKHLCEVQTNTCKSAGCALGELPALWPKMFRWGTGRVLFLDITDEMSTDFHTMKERDPLFHQIHSGFFYPAYWLSLNAMTVNKLFNTPSAGLDVSWDSEPGVDVLTKKLMMDLVTGLEDLESEATPDDVADGIELFCKLWEEECFPVTDTEEYDKEYEAQH